MRYLIAAAALLGLCAASAQADESTFSYNLKSGLCKVLPLLPVHNVPINIMAANIPSGSIRSNGPGDITLVWYTNYGGLGVNMFNWVGQDFSGNTTGSSNVNGTHVMWVGATTVELQIYSDTRLRVCNINPDPQQGTISMTWVTTVPH